MVQVWNPTHVDESRRDEQARLQKVAPKEKPLVDNAQQGSHSGLHMTNSHGIVHDPPDPFSKREFAGLLAGKERPSIPSSAAKEIPSNPSSSPALVGKELKSIPSSIGKETNSRIERQDKGPLAVGERRNYGCELCEITRRKSRPGW